MTRKDFVALAEALHGVEIRILTDGNTLESVWRRCVDSIADVLAADNPRFDRERFIRACQGEKS